MDQLKKANSEFVDEHYTAALEHYNKAIELMPKDVEVLNARASCLYKLQDYLASITDANMMIKEVPQDPRGYYRKGLASFALEEYATARKAFQQAVEKGGQTQWSSWIQKCDIEIAHEAQFGSESTSDMSDDDQSAPTLTEPDMTASNQQDLTDQSFSSDDDMKTSSSSSEKKIIIFNNNIGKKDITFNNNNIRKKTITFNNIIIT